MAILRAICIATPNINTVNYSNIYNFLKFFECFCCFSLGVTVIGYFIVSSGNGMVFNFTKFTIFLIKLAVFSNFLTLIVIIQVFQLQGARNLVKDLLIVCCKMFIGHGISQFLKIFVNF